VSLIFGLKTIGKYEGRIRFLIREAPGLTRRMAKQTSAWMQSCPTPQIPQQVSSSTCPAKRRDKPRTGWGQALERGREEEAHDEFPVGICRAFFTAYPRIGQMFYFVKAVG
jgi:hypothetical protein